MKLFSKKESVGTSVSIKMKNGYAEVTLGNISKNELLSAVAEHTKIGYKKVGDVYTEEKLGENYYCQKMTIPL